MATAIKRRRGVSRGLDEKPGLVIISPSLAYIDKFALASSPTGMSAFTTSELSGMVVLFTAPRAIYVVIELISMDIICFGISSGNWLVTESVVVTVSVTVTGSSAP